MSYDDDDTDDVTTAKKTGKTASAPDDSMLASRWCFNNPKVCYGLGEWRKYNNGVWQRVDEEVIKHSIRQLIDAARPEGVRCTNNMITSVAKIVYYSVFKPTDIWDAHPNFVPCKNGLLDIPSKSLLPHTPDIYATSALPFEYDVTADCPTFKKALQRIPNETDFLQEFAGYSLTPDTKHEIAVWFHGIPGSGKSTVIEGIKTMLGDRAGLLSLMDIERSKFALVNLPGKTLVTATENPDMYMRATHLLNTIISGETITVERKYFDAFDIRPHAKILWAMNDLPRIQSTHDGIMRRVKIINYPALPESEKDVTMQTKIRTEGAGILNWALAGLDRLRNRGYFEIPDSIKNATNKFKENNDILKQFFEDVGATIDPLDPNLKMASGYLYSRYKEWCIETSHKPLSSTSIADEWRKHGLTKIRANAGSFWQGIDIK